ncbi:glycine cleavage T C-terminal barrel domain-containing protein [Salinarimonas sp.]|uniref:glycine cleavage T C-terminal barrel domain-containing protein n=1 Tax=Salinarimonas sp. TaxID=2766526 RepID=UPI0032D8EC3A
MQDDYLRVRETVACFAGAPACAVAVTGADAEAWLNAAFAKDVEAIVPLKGAIGLFLEHSGDVFAMASVFRKEDDGFLVFSDRRELRDRLIADADGDVAVTDIAATHGLVNVIGPKAMELMTEIAGEDIVSIPYMGFEESVDGDYVVFRQSFTGEFEFRLMAPHDGFDALYSRVLEAAREMGGGEIDPAIIDLVSLEMRFIKDADVIGRVTALEAGLHWMIDFRKEDFVGRDAVLREKSDLKRKSLIVRLDEAGVAEAGADLMIEARPVGKLVRVVYSPRLETDIAFAFVERDIGWVGVNYAVRSGEGRTTLASAVSSPLFLSRSVLSD